MNSCVDPSQGRSTPSAAADSNTRTDVVPTATIRPPFFFEPSVISRPWPTFDASPFAVHLVFGQLLGL